MKAENAIALFAILMLLQTASIPFGAAEYFLPQRERISHEPQTGI
jgi:hypothetical protein